MKLSSIGTVVAERRLDLHPRGQVIVRVGKPRKFRGDANYFCPFEIRWPDRIQRSYVGGVDPVQALYLALQMIGVELYVSKAQLSWLGERDLDFPVTRGMENLVPKKRKRSLPSSRSARPARRRRR